jgi:SEC-C motif
VTEIASARPHIPPPQLSPTRNGPCLCGSGLKYKHCCADRLPGHDHLGSRTRKLLNEENFKAALHACRADLTQYTIWHKSHTEPAVRRGMPKKGSLLEVDIRAMSEIVDDLLLCHIKTEMMSDFPAVLERLRGNINDPAWQLKITYLHALTALGPDWEEIAGRRELRKLGSIADDEDVEILQLYLDLFGDDLTFSEKLEIIDRILALSKKFSDRIHYRASKAALFFTIGDRRKAESELTDAIAEARSKSPSGDFIRDCLAFVT